jgi:hypothetical protein
MVAAVILQSEFTLFTDYLLPCCKSHISVPEVSPLSAQNDLLKLHILTSLILYFALDSITLPL